MNPDYFLEAQTTAMLWAEQDAPLNLSLPGSPSDLEVRFIDKKAIVEQNKWVGAKHSFEWARIASFKFLQPPVIDFAMWHGDILCGLCCAFVSGDEVQIDTLQGCPVDDHPLDGYVVKLATYVLSTYGALIGATEITVPQPLEGAIQVYRENDFTYDGGLLVYEIPRV